MFLKKFIYINWGNLPNREFEFGPINLLSGGNGSGKTTAADAIQTIMTAAHDTLFAYNPGQEETSQRGRGGKQTRTLASYVLGCDDGSYARPYPTDGYIAAVFHPTQGETATPFTAVIGNRAYLETAGESRLPKLAESAYLLVNDRELCLDDFMQAKLDGQHLVPLPEIQGHLIRQLDVSRDIVEKYDTKKQYLGRLYGALRGLPGRVTDREAMAAARAFSGFMAYKPEKKGIHHFVANEILEKKDLGEAVQSVSSLMKSIHGMEEDARKLKEAIGLLGQADQQALTYIEHWVQLHEAHYIRARTSYLADQKRYQEVKRQQSDLQARLDANQKELESSIERQRETTERITDLKARRLGISALRTKDELERSIQEAEEALAKSTAPLLQQEQYLQQNLAGATRLGEKLSRTSVADAVPGLAQAILQDRLKAVQLAAQADLPRAQSLLNRDWIDSSALEGSLDRIQALQQASNRLLAYLHDPSHSSDQRSTRDQVIQERDRRERALSQLEHQVERKKLEIEALEARQVNYPDFVAVALKALRSQCPQADARVLCDYVEVTDPAWQSAIEGYLGGARFGIVVEPQYEAEAIRILRQLPGRQNRARVIQGSKAREDADKLASMLPKNSLMQVLKCSHAIVKSYLIASYGRVERVDSADELAKSPRGVTRDGMGSSNYSMYRCDIPDSELVFGQGARERALKAKQDELEQLYGQLQAASGAYQDMRQLLTDIDQIRPLAYAEVLTGLAETQRQLHQAQEALRQLDLSDFEALEQELGDAQALYRELDAQISQLAKDNGQTQEKLVQVDAQIRGLADRRDQTLAQVDDEEEALRRIPAVWPEYDFERRLQAADQTAQSSQLALLDQDIQYLGNHLNADLAQLENAIQQHNLRCDRLDSVLFDRNYDDNHGLATFKLVCHKRQELDNIHNRLKNNVLVEHHDKLVDLKRTFNTAFISNLCHAIYQAIGDGRRVLEELNEELENHVFGADQETYSFKSDWVPEFHDYWKFFEEIVKQPLLGEAIDLSELELSERSRKVRDRLMAMLLDDDEIKAMRELERVSDYRNYRRYEIYRQPKGKAPIPLSQYGTGSGGQSETPFYIIRSAAVTAAFRFREGNSHLRMVMVDEAFSRMDETRSREVIDYLTKTLGLQLLFVMPSSKSGAFLDLISNQFVFAKCPAPTAQGELQTLVHVDRQKLNQDRIQALWANHKRTIYNQASFDFMEEFG